MVNWVELIENQILYKLVKTAGLRHQMVEVEPGTVISLWAPRETKKNKKEKPAVVLVHGFAGDGIFTWLFQVLALASTYSVYVPDLLFFGRSTTTSPDRSVGFQAGCLMAALARLGVRRCTVVGFSYGGMMAFKMAEERPELVRSLVVSGAVPALTGSIRSAILERIGLSSFAQLLLPDSVEGVTAQYSIATSKNLRFPDFLSRDYLKAMVKNRNQRAELLKGMVINDVDVKEPNLHQKVYLLWGEDDNIFNMETAMSVKQQLGEKATLHSIKRAGHLVQLERPLAYNRRLKKILALIHAEAQGTITIDQELHGL